MAGSARSCLAAAAEQPGAFPHTDEAVPRHSRGVPQHARVAVIAHPDAHAGIVGGVHLRYRARRDHRQQAENAEHHRDRRQRPGPAPQQRGAERHGDSHRQRPQRKLPPQRALEHRGRDDRTDEQRDRFAALYLEAADEAGLPGDPPFRESLRSHVEFGTHVAQQNSWAETDADLNPIREVPHWEWPTC